jgi:hypothetical protein
MPTVCLYGICLDNEATLSLILCCSVTEELAHSGEDGE